MSLEARLQQAQNQLNSQANAMQGKKVPLARSQSPEALAIASAVRYNKLLKQRQGINSGAGHPKQDFFRYKRFVRALESDDYKKKSLKQPELLPQITDDAHAQKIFIMLIQNQLVLPVRKMKTKESQNAGLAVTKNTPGLQVISKAVLKPDCYFMWNYTPPNPFLWLYSILGLIVVFGVVLFPLWPSWMRGGVWYLSTGLLILIGAFFGLAIIRLIIYLITLVAMTRQFWLFPNLFADCGVIDSFKPLYGWEDSETKHHKHHKHVKHPTKGKSSSPAVHTTGASTKQTTAKPRAPKIEEIDDEGEA